MPWYEHQCQECNFEFEDLYSINADSPTICPECGKNAVKRLISLTAKGVVELTGQDLKRHVKQEAKKIANESSKNEKLKSNLIGEAKFNQLVK